jgi:hypothetical protein
MSFSETRAVPIGANRNSRLGRLAGAGFAGGFVGWALSEVLVSQEYDYSNYETAEELQNAVRWNTSFWFMLIILGIGAAIIIVDQLMDKWPITGEKVAISAVSLIVGGLLSGYIAQTVFEGMLPEFEEVTVSDVRPARIIGWLIAGALGGGAVGLTFRTAKRVQNGVLGGAGGGLIGGALFDSFGSDGTARLVGVCVIGALMGLLIGGIDQARTNLWIEVVSGEMKGRLFLLMDDKTIIGSDRSLQVCLLSDRSIQPQHLEIRFSNGVAEFSVYGSAPTLHNGSSVSGGRLAGGDILKIGNTDVRVGYSKISTDTSSSVASGQPYSPPNNTSEPKSRMTAYEASQLNQPQPTEVRSPQPTQETTRPPVVRPRIPTKPQNE